MFLWVRSAFICDLCKEVTEHFICGVSPVESLEVAKETAPSHVTKNELILRSFAYQSIFASVAEIPAER